MSDAEKGADLLDRPAEEAVRLVALAELARAREARLALARGDDPEALHDFRVGLRRLRSQLRAYRAQLGDAVPKRLARELRKIARATSPGRDAEAGIHLLGTLPHGEHLAGRRRNGRAALVERLAVRLQRTLDAARADLVARFDRAERKLAARLSELTVELAPSSRPESFRELFVAELRRHHEALVGLLGATEESDDGEPAEDDLVHAARIAAKRLRYLMDPVVDSIPEGQSATKRLRGLQDLLGELNDLRMLAAEAGAYAAELEGDLVARVAKGGARERRRRPRERAALLELGERIATARSELRRRLAADWVEGEAPERAALDADLGALERALER